MVRVTEQGKHEATAHGGTAGPDVASARAWCERYARAHTENFTVVSWFLPKRRHAPMFAVYAFCRYTDDLGDEAPGDRLALLDEWDAELQRAFGGQPQHAITVALQSLRAKHPLEPEPFRRLIAANQRDQQQSRYETFADLLDYCDASANPVGQMVLALFGYTDPFRRSLSDATCTGAATGEPLAGRVAGLRVGPVVPAARGPAPVRGDGGADCGRGLRRQLSGLDAV